jgi:hypothetical protein
LLLEMTTYTSTTTTETSTQKGQAPQMQPASHISTPEQTTTKDHISKLFNCHFKRAPGGGDGDNEDGGGGGPGLPGWAQPGALVLVQSAQDIKAMGKLPEPFYGNQTKAERFMQEVKAYLRLNQDVPGFDSPIKKVAFILTHMKGPDIASWARDAGEVLDNL